MPCLKPPRPSFLGKQLLVCKKSTLLELGKECHLTDHNCGHFCLAICQAADVAYIVDATTMDTWLAPKPRWIGKSASDGLLTALKDYTNVSLEL